MAKKASYVVPGAAVGAIAGLIVSPKKDTPGELISAKQEAMVTAALGAAVGAGLGWLLGKV